MRTDRQSKEVIKRVAIGLVALMVAAAGAPRTSAGSADEQPTLADRLAGNTLSATSRPNRVSRARYTSPMPPAPSEPRTSCGPSFIPAVSRIECDYSPGFTELNGSDNSAVIA